MKCCSAQASPLRESEAYLKWLAKRSPFEVEFEALRCTAFLLLSVNPLEVGFEKVFIAARMSWAV
jgi:hypothetical protein